MNILELLNIKKILTNIVICVGGAVIIALWNKWRFSENYKLLKQNEKSYVDKHYVAYIKNKGYSSNMGGRRLCLCQELPFVNCELLMDIKNNLIRSKYFFRKNRLLAETTAKHIELYLNTYKDAKEILSKKVVNEDEKDKLANELSCLSKQNLEGIMAIFFYLNRLSINLTTKWNVSNNEFMSSLYFKYSKEQNMTKLPAILNEYKLLYSM